MNPWKPPSGWDQPDGSERRDPVTIRGVLGSMLSSFGRQPFAALLFVLILPGLWLVPASIVEKLLVPADQPAFDPTLSIGGSPRSIAASWAGYAWNSVGGALQLGAAIAVVRGQRIRWRAYVASAKRAPQLFVTTAVVL